MRPPPTRDTFASMTNSFRSTLRTLRLAGGLASLLLLGACSDPEPSAKPDRSPGVLAVVGDTAIDEARFRHAWERRIPASDTAESRGEILDSLIRQSAFAEAARAAGLDRDPLVVEQVERLLVGRLREVQLAPMLAEVSVTDEEVREYFETHQAESFHLPGQVRSAVLWFDTRGQEPLMARYRPRLDEVRAAIADGSDAVPPASGFGAFALRNSEHRASRTKGGDLGWLQDGRPMDKLHAIVAELAAELALPGDLSPVTARPEGLFLVRLIDRRDPRPLDLAEVSGKIRQQLLRERREHTEERWTAEMLESCEIARRPERLEALRDLPVREREMPPFNPPASSGSPST